ncbi:sensor domain-containing diguanylate cyclase [bacterium]|nr:sensor domain-containing diguanylate cyclase [bacterium]
MTSALGVALGVAIVIIIFLAISKAKSNKAHETRHSALVKVIEASQQLGTSTSLEAVMSVVSECVKTLLPVDSVAVYLLDESSVEETKLEAKGVSSAVGECFRNFDPDTEISCIGKVISERRALSYKDFNAEATDEAVLPRDKDFRSVMVAPLLVEGRAIGAVFVSYHQADKYSSEEQHFFGLLSNQVALAVRNAQLQEGLTQMATRDTMTGLFTHAYFQEHLGKSIVKAKYNNQAVALMILDMDFFKKVNDNYGHPQGDALLKQLGGVIRSVVTSKDTIARYGGDEFTVTMLDTNRTKAVVVAEKIRLAVEEFEFVLGANIVHITISGGVAAYPEDCTTKKELIAKADAAMYEAKKQGRNRICFSA